MNDRNHLEFSVGAFLLLGLGALIYLAVHLGDLSLFRNEAYQLSARFVSSSGLNIGAFVEVGGVRVGKVDDIYVDYDTYESVVVMSIDPKIRLQTDTIASIRTSGIIGDKFVKIAPGGAEDFIDPNGEILETESSISLEELISKYIFESNDD